MIFRPQIELCEQCGCPQPDNADGVRELWVSALHRLSAELHDARSRADAAEAEAERLRTSQAVLEADMLPVKPLPPALRYDTLEPVGAGPRQRWDGEPVTGWAAEPSRRFRLLGGLLAVVFVALVAWALAADWPGSADAGFGVQNPPFHPGYGGVPPEVSDLLQVPYRL